MIFVLRLVNKLLLKLQTTHLLHLKIGMVVNNLKNIKNETLIVWGDKDKSYDINQIKILKKNILNSSLAIFKDCAHNVHLEKVDEFNNKIQEFLNNLV